MSRRIVAIVQARMSSSQLPGKVLLEIGEKPMLERVAERLSRASLVQEVVVATTTDPADDTLSSYCNSHSLACYRGSQYDVLDRYYQAARAFSAEIVVRITADCPLVDADLVDETIRVLLGGNSDDESGNAGLGTKFDFSANRLPPPWPRTFPIGLDVEVSAYAALERAWKEASDPAEREHVMPYMYEEVELRPAGKGLSVGNSPHGFRVALLGAPEDHGTYRWTVDTIDDLEFVRQVYGHFAGREYFSWTEVLDLIRSHPDLIEINAGVRHKSLREVDERAKGSGQ